MCQPTSFTNGPQRSLVRPAANGGFEPKLQSRCQVVKGRLAELLACAANILPFVICDEIGGKKPTVSYRET
ncbi:hypothetical protein C1J03_18880 [Sulfitobacter sp. SK012]|nr:hypothetical protein C1J03_18880 [Sulfitobacter sp. SK012]